MTDKQKITKINRELGLEALYIVIAIFGIMLSFLFSSIKDIVIVVSFAAISFGVFFYYGKRIKANEALIDETEPDGHTKFKSLGILEPNTPDLRFEEIKSDDNMNITKQQAFEDLKMTLFPKEKYPKSKISDDTMTFFIHKEELSRETVISILSEYFEGKNIVDGQCSVSSVTLVWTTFAIENRNVMKSEIA